MKTGGRHHNFIKSYFNRYLQIDLDIQSWSIFFLSKKVLYRTNHETGGIFR